MKAAGLGEGVEGGGFFFFRAVHGDEDAGRLGAGREHDLGDDGGEDAGIGELAFEHGADFLGEGMGDSVAVVDACAWFGHVS